MPGIISACDVRANDLVASNDGRNLQVIKITSSKSKCETTLNFYLDDGSIWRKITPQKKILLLCRPAVYRPYK